MSKLTKLSEESIGLKVNRYTERVEEATGKPNFYEVYCIRGNLPQGDLQPVLVRHAFSQEVPFSEKGNTEAMEIMSAANQAGGLFTADDVETYAKMMNNIKQESAFKDTRIPYTPNNDKHGDYQNWAHEQAENSAFDKIFIPQNEKFDETLERLR